MSAFEEGGSTETTLPEHDHLREEGGSASATVEEDILRSFRMHIPLNQAQYRALLTALGFLQMPGTGSSHTKWRRSSAAGTTTVILAKLDHFNDARIKADLFRGEVPLHPEFVFWHYCRLYGDEKSKKYYRNAFGKDFSSKDPPREE